MKIQYLKRKMAEQEVELDKSNYLQSSQIL